MVENREQKLVDIMFQIGLMLSSPLYKMRDLPEEEKASWIVKQLEACGFPTYPSGMSWGVLHDS